jgi:hypothetical protein
MLFLLKLIDPDFFPFDNSIDKNHLTLYISYGILISKSETETHCYARTHKGNTKILSKGLASWWMLG